MKNLNNRGFTLVEGLLLIIAISLVAGVGYYVYQSNNNKNESPEQVSTTQPLQSEEKKAEPRELVEYNPAIEIRSEQDIVKLTDASDSFKQYIKAELASQQKQKSPDCDNDVLITVKAIYKDELAGGGIGSCGGARFVWKKIDSAWRMIEELGGQDYPLCSDVIKYQAPKAIIDQCFDQAKNDVIQNPNS
jgi:Tfp pilus assembly protein PilE